MSKRRSPPHGAGSHGARNTSNKSTSEPSTTRNAGQTGGTAPQKASGGVSPQESANYRARRAAAMRASAPTKASGQPRVGARPSQKRARNVPWWQRGNTPIFATVGVVAALVIIFVVIARLRQPSNGNSTNSNLGTATSASVAQAVTQVSPSVINAVGTGSVTNTLQATKGAPLLVGTDGKPKMVYIGADYCPFCAAERWSLIVSLSRFGTFANLHDMASSSSDVYPSTPTFSFYGSTYTSQYVDFTAVETTTQDPNTPLQTPTAEQQQLLTTYDAPPYTSSQNAGSIPFVDIGGRYVLSGSGFSPQLLQGLTRDQIAQKLSTANDPVTKAIVGHANYLTAAICVATQNKPAQVCSTSTIQAIEQNLPKGS